MNLQTQSAMKLVILLSLLSKSTSFISTSTSFSREAITTLQAKKYVVVGGGWGGWGAAKALCEGMEDVDVTLIDALPDPTGVSYEIVRLPNDLKHIYHLTRYFFLFIISSVPHNY